MKKIAAVILKNKRGQILLMKRDDDPDIPFPNTWDLVGGHIEEGESPEEALRRETKEEIGCEPDTLSFWRQYEVQEGDVYPNVKYIFRGTLSKPVSELTRGEGQELRFYEPQEIASLQLANVIWGILQDYLRETTSK